VSALPSLLGAPPDEPAFVQYAQEQYRLHGHDGIQKAWRTLKALKIDLPTDDGAAELWDLFLRAPNLREEVRRYAVGLKRRTGRFLKPLYTLFMSRLICSGIEVPREVLLEHHRSFQTYFIPPSAMEDLAPYATVSTMALNAYYQLYVHGNTKGTKAMYDAIVSTLCRHREWVLAFHFHRALTNSGIKVESNPIVDELNSNPSLKEALYDHLWAMSVESGERDPLESVALSDIDLEPAPQLGVNDKLAARLFATRRFPLSIVMAGLRLCNVTDVGPIALRELLARATTVSDAVDYWALLRRSGIKVRWSAYAMTATKILETNQLPLLHNFLDCDLRADTFADAQTQRNLLQYYVSQGDLLSAKRAAVTLGVLSQEFSSNNPWIQMFKSFCEKRNLSQLSVLVDDMVSAGLPLDRKATQYLVNHFYPTHPTMTSVIQREELLPFAANIKILYLRCGMVPPITLYAYDVIISGRIGHLDRVGRMTNYMGLTLCRGSELPPQRLLRSVVTDPPNVAASLQQCLPPEHNAKAVARLFGFRAIQGILTWGFKLGRRNLRSRRGEKTGPKVVLLGLVYLKHLIRVGVQISPARVATCLRWRFWVLYGFQPVRGKDNFLARRLVRFSLEQLLLSINRLWPLGDLFPEIFTGPNKEEILLRGLQRKTMDEISALPYKERIRKRVALRLRIYGKMPSGEHVRSMKRAISPTEWRQWIIKDAEQADAISFRGRYGSKTSGRYLDL
jgi:hypothetical protein